MATHVCLDCGALGQAGGYHDHGAGNAGETIALERLPAVVRSWQQIEAEKLELEDERGELEALLREALELLGDFADDPESGQGPDATFRARVERLLPNLEVPAA